MLKFICSLSASSALLLVSFAANASPITINSSLIRSDVVGTSGVDLDTDTSLAYGARSLLAVSGASISTTDINWVDTGSGALLDFDFNHARTGAGHNYAQSFESTLVFTANENTTYSIGGQYSVDHVTSAGRSYSYARLWDVANSVYLFLDLNESRNTIDEIFTVGIGAEGDHQNQFIGNQIGNLIAGNQYRFFFNNFIQAQITPDGGASATGCVTLSIGGASGAGGCGSSVPEPMPLTLLGAGLAALGLRRRLRVKAV